MTAKNVLPKVWKNGEWVELHIVTKAANVLTDDAKTLQQKIDDFTSHLADTALHVSNDDRVKWNNKVSTYKSSKDTDGNYVVVEKRRPDGTLLEKSVLSNPNANGQYTVRTVTEYEEDGSTVKNTLVYDLIYDEDGDLINEVLRP